MINSCVENVSENILRTQDELHWVDFYGFKTSMPHCYHFKFKITQTSVFLNFLKTVSDGNWNLKGHKNQCLSTINSYEENVSQYTLRPQDELHCVDFYGLNQHLRLLPFLIKNYTNIGIFKFLKNCFRWKLEPKST